MRTRRGNYPLSGLKRDGNNAGTAMTSTRKRVKMSSSVSFDLFDALPDDIVLSILTRLGSIADCPADFVAVLATCKRFNGLGMDSSVLAKASAGTFAVSVKQWSPYAHLFLKKCSDAGNIEACYVLGMIEFYCFQKWGIGASLMARAAIKSHPPALFSLAVIYFNGSGGPLNGKDLRAGVSLCVRAAILGNNDALRELGHCLLDGYGLTKNIDEGRRILIEASARDLGIIPSTTPSSLMSGNWLNLEPVILRLGIAAATGIPFLGNRNFSPPELKIHPANRFLVDWFSYRIPSPGLRICSYGGCGRPETRMNEFRRCALCAVELYCSKACQAIDWRIRHKEECGRIRRFLSVNGNLVGGAANAGGR